MLSEFSEKFLQPDDFDLAEKTPGEFILHVTSDKAQSYLS